MLSLTPRLQAAADLIDNRCRSLTDIGTDHGYLPIYLLKAGKISHAVAADVRMGPLAKAKENIDMFGVNAHLALSDGFDNITEKSDVCTICGMGGETMRDIIIRGGEITPDILILQPMTGIEKLRKFLYENRFDITDEVFVSEGNRVYCVLKAEKSENASDFCYADLFLGKIRPKTEEFSQWVKKIKSQGEKRLLGGENEDDQALVAECDRLLLNL